MRVLLIIAAVVVAVLSLGTSVAGAASVSDPNYREGFGKNATGGSTQATCRVSSSNQTGTGSLDACLQRGGNQMIVFSVPVARLIFNRRVWSNTTIDGCANGQHGVTLDVPANDKRSLVIEDPSSNIVIRCINFRSTGIPNSGVAEFDLLSLDGTNGGTLSNVFIDRCTFMQASDGAIDITGRVTNVTVQRSLFYNNAITSLIKYGTRRNISFHHNVLTHNGERNPQAKGYMRLLDFVNNVIHINEGDVTHYSDGSQVDPSGLRIWNAGPASDSPGNVVVNVTANAFLGDRAFIQLITDAGASAAGVFIGASNYCRPTTNCPASPRAIPTTIPAGYAVTTLRVDQLRSQLLPSVGAPNRTALDQQRINAVAALLPTARLHPGDRVKVINGAHNVRSAPNSTLPYRTLPQGSVGTILGGPSPDLAGKTTALYYNVNFDTQPDGWMSQTWLQLLSP